MYLQNSISKLSASGFEIERRQSEATEVSTHSVSFARPPRIPVAAHLDGRYEGWGLWV